MRSDEPNDRELRDRIRRWVRHYIRHNGWSQREFAQAMSLSEATVSNLVYNKEEPGLDTLVRMHFRLGADLTQLVRIDPPSEARSRATMAQK